MAPPEPSLAVRHRNLEMRMFVDATRNRCATPYDYACGNYASVNGLQPFDDLHARANLKTKRSAAVASCEENLTFNGCFVDSFVDEDPEIALWKALLVGITVNGWAARAGMHDERVALHIWDTMQNRSDLVMHVNPECAVQEFVNTNNKDAMYHWYYDVDQNEFSDDDWFYTNEQYDIVVYESANNTFCNFTDIYYKNGSNVTYSTPVDCPKTCLEAVRRFAPQSLTDNFALPLDAIKRLEKLAENLRNIAEVNTTIAIGAGAGLVPDTDVSGNLSEVWLKHLRAEMIKLGQRLDYPVWPAAADTVNAFYDPCQNTVFIPYGILNTPFFDATYDDELVAGGIGFVIAHELGHAVDHLRHNQSFGVAVVSHMSKTSHIPFTTVNHTMAEDVADFLGSTFVAQMQSNAQLPLTERLGLQFSQLWCLGDGPFTADQHAPGAVRANAILQPGGPFDSIFC